MRLVKLSAGAGLIALTAILLSHLVPLGGAPEPSASVAPPAAPGAHTAADAPFRWAFPAGERLVYRFHLTADTRASGGLTLAGRADLQGRLRLEGVGAEGPVHRVAVRLEPTGAPRFDLLGQPLFPDLATARTLLAGEAVAEYAADGRLVRVLFREETTPLFQHLASALLADAQVVVPDGRDAADAWLTEEDTSLGRRRVATRLATADASRVALARTTEAYLSLTAAPSAAPSDLTVTGQDEVVLDRRGFLRALDRSESVRHQGADGRQAFAHDGTLALHLDRVEPVPSRRVSARDLQPLRPRRQAAAAPRASAHQLLVNRAAGLTGPQLLADLARYAGGTAPDHARWLWRATGLLRLDPSLADALADLALSGDLTSSGRALVLDLLASAGHAEAQAALRAILGADISRDDPAYLLHVQRLSLVTRPEPATVAFARETWQTADAPHVKNAAAYTLGATAGALYRAGDADAAQRELAPLLARLDDAETPAEAAELLRSLGNAGLPEHLPTLLARIDHPDPDVRAAVAAALRKLGSGEARAALRSLLGDAHPLVRRETLQSMTTAGLTAEDVEAIVAHVVLGGFEEKTFGDLLGAFATVPEHGALLVPALEAMLASPIQSAKLRARISALLAQVG